jgi:hypothetical protein
MTTYRIPAHDERRAAGARTNPTTAIVWFTYAESCDPYGDFMVPDEISCIGREWFATGPNERPTVHFSDLPETTRDLLEEKRRVADREGWEEISRCLRAMT